MLFWQGDYINSEYKQWFKGQIEVMEAYNGGVLFGNILGATAREIATLGLDIEIGGDMEKITGVGKGKILGTAFSGSVP